MENYNRDNISRARRLRREMTREERRLWYDFLKDYPVKFRRQVPIGNYIVDFYCVRAKVILEVDGSQHYEDAGIRRDQLRTQELESLGLSVVRIPNNEVIRNFDGVCAYIHGLVSSRIL